MCVEGSPQVDGLGRERILSSPLCDAYLHRTRAARGYAVAVWRGRHVTELTQLTDDEAAEFDRAVRAVARALERHYGAAKLNLLTLGNEQPHLHVHIVPRYLTDDAPGAPPRFMMVDEEQPPIPDAEYLEDVAALHRLINDLYAPPHELFNVQRVAVGAAAAMRDDRGRILLVRHSYGHLNWELPGGSAEPGETPERAAVREVREETGLTVVPEGIVAIYVETGHRLGEAMHIVVRCRREPADAEPRIASDEITDWRFVDPSDPPRPISDFTIRRMTDALAGGPPPSRLIERRRWLE
jgi:8-oxo-dGTP diphosphatase